VVSIVVERPTSTYHLTVRDEEIRSGLAVALIATAIQKIQGDKGGPKAYIKAKGAGK
jgi:hypothetical protein